MHLHEAGWGYVSQGGCQTLTTSTVARSCSTRDQLKLQVTGRTKDVIHWLERETSQTRDTENCFHPSRYHIRELKEDGSFMQKELSYLENVQLLGSDRDH